MVARLALEKEKRNSQGSTNISTSNDDSALMEAIIIGDQQPLHENEGEVVLEERTA